MTGRELGTRVEAQNKAQRCYPFLAVDGTDLRWLLGNGLIERRDEPAAAGRQVGRVYWRATELGSRVMLLDWRAILGEG